MNFRDKLIVSPGKPARLAKLDTDDTLGYQKDHKTKAALAKQLERLDALQYLLYAERKHALLVVLQSLDAGGKDGTIRHVMSGVNPQGCVVTAFKTPTAEEASHDFLWRVHKAVPPRGDFGIFNRSHYEDVLVVRVHNLVPKAVWSKRYEQINEFEKSLAESGVQIVKFFLHISKQEQKKRFQERLDDPDKRWKVSPADFAERQFWSDYRAAYEDAITLCSKPWAPWYVVPADKKWFRNLAVSRILVETLEGLHMKFPPPSFDVSHIKIK
jgi:PPK2 family polyphosphate:nucleotide phosphotransferase